MRQLSYYIFSSVHLINFSRTSNRDYFFGNFRGTLNVESNNKINSTKIFALIKSVVVKWDILKKRWRHTWIGGNMHRYDVGSGNASCSITSITKPQGIKYEFVTPTRFFYNSTLFNVRFLHIKSSLLTLKYWVFLFSCAFMFLDGPTVFHEIFLYFMSNLLTLHTLTSAKRVCM